MTKEKEEPKSELLQFAESFEKLDIYRIIPSGDGYDIQQLVAYTHRGIKMEWDYITSAKSLRKARKELSRLTKGAVYA